MLYRLGDDLLVRLPKIGWATGQVESDARWLPFLGEHLPVDVPVPLAVGEPGEGYPYRWSVTRWLPGAAAAPGTFDAVPVARQAAELVVALRAVDTTGGPVKDGTSRGVPLDRLDPSVRDAIAACGTRVDAAAVTRAWDRALEARPSSGGAWIHGDLLPGNLLVHEGCLSGAIDWGGVGVGDPAADLIPAWTLFRGEARERFREAAAEGLPHPEDAWERARGWVLVQGVIGLPYYWDRWPEFAREGLARVDEVLAEG